MRRTRLTHSMRVTAPEGSWLSFFRDACPDGWTAEPGEPRGSSAVMVFGHEGRSARVTIPLAGITPEHLTEPLETIEALGARAVTAELVKRGVNEANAAWFAQEDKRLSP